MIARLRAWLDADERRRETVRDLFEMQAQLATANEKIEQLQTANRIMAGRLESERSMLNDQWRHVERLEKERDTALAMAVARAEGELFWKSEALKAGKEVSELRAALGCPLRVTPLTVVKGGKSA
jgi:hypothetical protein